MKSQLDAAIERFYADNAIVQTVRTLNPEVPEQVIHALFATGFSLGSLHGFCEARDTIETTLLEHARGAVAH